MIMNNMEDNKLEKNVRDNFIVSLVTYIRICNPKQIASDLNTISKYFSEESPIKKEIEPISDKTCKDIENIVEQIINDVKKINNYGANRKNN